MNPETESIRFAILATDIVCFRVLNNELYTLVSKAKEGSPFAGKWVLIGGLIYPKETAEESVSRLLLDKAGISEIYKEQLYTFSDIDRDPRGRVVSVAYISLCSDDPQKSFKNSVETKWVPFNSLPDLGYDHDQICKQAIEKLRLQIGNTDIARYLLPSEFTLSELQNIHQAVMSEKLDKRNFRKKILGLGILKDTKKTRKSGVMRPAAIYTFLNKR